MSQKTYKITEKYIDTNVYYVDAESQEEALVRYTKIGEADESDYEHLSTIVEEVGDSNEN